jgi:hypothetical protein
LSRNGQTTASAGAARAASYAVIPEDETQGPDVILRAEMSRRVLTRGGMHA